MELLLDLTSGLVAWVQQLVYQLVEFLKDSKQVRAPMPLGGGLAKVPPADGDILGMSAPLSMDNSGKGGEEIIDIPSSPEPAAAGGEAAIDIPSSPEPAAAGGEAAIDIPSSPEPWGVPAPTEGGSSLWWGGLDPLPEACYIPEEGPEASSIQREGTHALPAFSGPAPSQGPTPPGETSGEPEAPKGKKLKSVDLEEGALRFKAAQESWEWAAFLKKAQASSGGERAALSNLERDLATTHFYTNMLLELKSDAALLNNSPLVRREEEWAKWVAFLKMELLSKGGDYTLQNVWKLYRSARQGEDLSGQSSKRR